MFVVGLLLLLLVVVVVGWEYVNTIKPFIGN